MEGIANRLAALLRNCHRKMQLSLSSPHPRHNDIHVGCGHSFCGSPSGLSSAWNKMWKNCMSVDVFGTVFVTVSVYRPWQMDKWTYMLINNKHNYSIQAFPIDLVSLAGTNNWKLTSLKNSSLWLVEKMDINCEVLQTQSTYKSGSARPLDGYRASYVRLAPSPWMAKALNLLTDVGK